MTNNQETPAATTLTDTRNNDDSVESSSYKNPSNVRPPHGRHTNATVLSTVLETSGEHDHHSGEYRSSKDHNLQSRKHSHHSRENNHHSRENNFPSSVHDSQARGHSHPSRDHNTLDSSEDLQPVKLSVVVASTTRYNNGNIPNEERAVNDTNLNTEQQQYHQQQRLQQKQQQQQQHQQHQYADVVADSDSDNVSRQRQERAAKWSERCEQELQRRHARHRDPR